MGIDATKGEVLTLGLASVTKKFCGKNAIVGMVSLDSSVMRGC